MSFCHKRKHRTRDGAEAQAKQINSMRVGLPKIFHVTAYKCWHADCPYWHVGHNAKPKERTVVIESKPEKIPSLQGKVMKIILMNIPEEEKLSLLREIGVEIDQSEQIFIKS